MEHDFDREVAARAAGDGRWVAEITDRWDIFTVPNGGFLASVVVDAMARTMPHPDPMAVSVHYPSRVVRGPAEIEVGPVRAGRRLSTVTARMAQEGEPRLLATATFADLSAARGPSLVLKGPPAIPPPDECVRAEGGMASRFLEHFDLRLTEESAAWATSRPSGRGEMAGWVRFVDGRPPDARSLVLMADAFPPVVFNLMETGWVPTVELSVQVRARPVAGWLQCRFTTRYVTDGYCEEDGEIWDAAGRLVALSRQLARVG